MFLKIQLFWENFSTYQWHKFLCIFEPEVVKLERPKVSQNIELRTQVFCQKNEL